MKKSQIMSHSKKGSGLLYLISSVFPSLCQHHGRKLYPPQNLTGSWRNVQQQQMLCPLSVLPLGPPAPGSALLPEMIRIPIRCLHSEILDILLGPSCLWELGSPQGRLHFIFPIALREWCVVSLVQSFQATRASWNPWLLCTSSGVFCDVSSSISLFLMCWL